MFYDAQLFECGGNQFIAPSITRLRQAGTTGRGIAATGQTLNEIGVIAQRANDNAEFTSPEEFSARDGLVINLKPGIYYWKAESVLKSEIRKLTINSEIDLKLKKLDEGYGITNAGNTRLDVEVYNGTSLIDKIKLDIDEDKNLSGTKFVGGWNEE